MKKSKQILLVLFVLLISISSKAQTKLKLPSPEELKTADDCTKYESLMIDAANWLEETDLDQKTNERANINLFVLQWISLSATVTVELNVELGKIYDKNIQLLGVYLASYAKYCINNKSSEPKFNATKAGIQSMMSVYKKGISIKKSKEMEKLLKLDNAQLDEYIKTKFK